MSSRRKKGPVISMPNGLFLGEDPDIRKEVADLLADPSEWLNTPRRAVRRKEAWGPDRNRSGTAIARPFAGNQVRYAYMNLAGCYALSTTPENKLLPISRIVFTDEATGKVFTIP